MHPVIKLFSLITVAFFLTQGGILTLLITGALMLPFYVQIPQLWRSAVFMVSRLKIFFLSIIIVYVFLSPVSLNEMSDINILMEVFMPGLFRIAVLISIIFAVNLYLKTTSREQILASLIWILKPLNYFNVNIDRVALRAVMTLEYIEYLNDKLTRYRQQKQQEKQDSQKQENSLRQKFILRKQAFFNLVRQSGIILHDILGEAERTSGKQYTIDCLQAPVLRQFTIPVVLSVLLFLTL